MKKYIIIVLVIAIILSLCINVLADKEDLEIINYNQADNNETIKEQKEEGIWDDVVDHLSRGWFSIVILLLIGGSVVAIVIYRRSLAINADKF